MSADTELRVGVDVVHFEDIPGVSITRGPTRRFAEAVINDINARGGAAGRRIVPVYHDYKSATFGKQEPEACAHYAEDAKVTVVIGQSFGHSEDFLACLAKHDILFIEAGRSQHDAVSFERFPRYVNPTWMNITRGYRSLVRSLAERGFFDGDVVVGLLTHDEPVYRRSVAGIAQALASVGVKLEKVVYESRFVSIAEGPSQARSSAVQMKEAGVNRIIMGSMTSGFFPDAAEAQHYRPRYALSSDIFPSSVLSFTKVKSQLVGTLGIGWMPIIDVREPEWERWPAWTRCLELMQKAGVQIDDYNAERGALHHCDVGWLLAAGAERAGARLTATSLLAGIESLGTSYQSTSSPIVRFGRDQHDGPSRFREFAYFRDCECFRYTSGHKPAR